MCSMPTYATTGEAGRRPEARAIRGPSGPDFGSAVRPLRLFESLKRRRGECALNNVTANPKCNGQQQIALVLVIVADLNCPLDREPSRIQPRPARRLQAEEQI